MCTATPMTGVCMVVLIGWIGASGCMAPRNRLAAARDGYMTSANQPVAGTKTRVQGTVGGAALGALVGGLIGGLRAGPGGAIAGAAAGATVGGAGGALYANHVVRERQRYADASAHLAQCTASLQKQIASGREFNETLESDLGNIESDQQQTRAAIREASAVRDRMSKEIQLQQQALAVAEKSHLPEPELNAQRASIRLLAAERDRLQAHISRLSRFRSGADRVPELR